MLATTLYIALGGAIGSALRFLTGAAIIRAVPQGFPSAVLSVNVIGSFVMGVFVVWSFQRGMGHLNPFVMTGILGGFTTFSAFSLEAFTLFEQGQSGQAAIYVASSVLLSLIGLALGVMLARGIWA